MKTHKNAKHISAGRNTVRRAKYAGDAATGDAAREAARERYHQQHSPQSTQHANPRGRNTARLGTGLLTRGEVREVICNSMDHPVAVESFTIPQAAEALGRGVATIRRWLQADRIPAPYLEDAARHHMVYSAGELEVIARVIAEHEREFVYLIAEHTHIVESLHQAVHAYRAEFL